MSGERRATQIAKIAAGRSATKKSGFELEAQTSRGMHSSLRSLATKGFLRGRNEISNDNHWTQQT
jgi:hypothetical protein